MNTTVRISILLCLLFSISRAPLCAQDSLQSRIETNGRISSEALLHSQVLDILRSLTDLNGPRLTWSPQFMSAARWVVGRAQAWGLENVHLEGWTPKGKGWSLKHFSLEANSPYAFPVISYPCAWSPSTHGTVTGDVILLTANTDSALSAAKGTLKGRFVMVSPERILTPHFEPLAVRVPDSSLLALANAELPPHVVQAPTSSPRWQRLAALGSTLSLCKDEGALALLSISDLDGGNVRVQSAAVPFIPGVTPEFHRSYEPDAPATIPQVVVGAEHYNRIVRLLNAGNRVRLSLNLQAEFNPPDSGYNVIAEIPGSDLKDQVVMIGAHLDSWHGGTGATDNGSGSAVCLEVMRILKTLDLKPRRTIRMALWGGEELGLLGSKAYVRRHLGYWVTTDSSSVLVLSPESRKVSVYLNDDNGTGKIRGVFLQGNEAARPIFRDWLGPFSTTGAATLTLRNTGSTDHISFDEIGIPAFQFIQDGIEYGSRTWHTTMDVFDRGVDDDLRQTAMIMAACAYDAAMRDELMPRKETGDVEVRPFPGEHTVEKEH
jgi:carboxypeptidase Q